MKLKEATQVGASGEVFWSLIFASALWTPVDDCLFPKQEFGVTSTPSRYLFCDECTKGFRVPKNGPFITQQPDEVKWANETISFLWKNFLAVERPQKSSSSFRREPVAFLPPMVIQGCSFRKELLINSPEQWAAFKAFFASLSTLIFMPSLRYDPAISLCCQHVTGRIYIGHGKAGQRRSFWKLEGDLPEIG